MDILGAKGVWDLVKAGGFAMWPLLLYSVVLWAVVFERIWSLWGILDKCREFQEKVIPVLSKGQSDIAADMCKGERLPVEKLCRFAISKQSTAHVEDKIETKRKQILHDLKKPLWILATIGASSPFIGLFGTVVGIIRSFHSIATTGTSGFTVVSAGISEALIATAAGIVVAVIAVIFYNYYNMKINRIGLYLKGFSDELLETFGK
jgi:biopolymer transport protein ExbB